MGEDKPVDTPSIRVKTRKKKFQADQPEVLDEKGFKRETAPSMREKKRKKKKNKATGGREGRQLNPKKEQPLAPKEGDVKDEKANGAQEDNKKETKIVTDDPKECQATSTNTTNTNTTSNATSPLPPSTDPSSTPHQQTNDEKRKYDGES